MVLTFGLRSLETMYFVPLWGGSILSLVVVILLLENAVANFPPPRRNNAERLGPLLESSSLPRIVISFREGDHGLGLDFPEQ